ncbi:Variable outer membrane protein [Borrelia duttonii CR2A]|uniref:Variable large protein n=1 Tax=Borrelia duttonii CR2A TaxID=1432657 RepID=W6TFY1_9SPIR|nr:Variable outer membrane protein [Borrelia duttonii CR2A]
MREVQKLVKQERMRKKSVGKLLGGQDKGEEAIAAAASATIGAVSGADILKAISVFGETSGEPTIQAAKNAAEIAAAKKDNDKTLDAAKKDAVIAAGIVLRGMAKDGKFAAKNDDKAYHAINGVVSSAVNKVLSTLTIAIRNRVDEGLKEINKVLGEIKEGEGSEVKTN